MPEERIIISFIGAYVFSFAIKSAIDIGVFDKLKVGKCNSEELANSLETNEKSIKRLMRVLIAIGFIKKVNEDYECTQIGELLQSDSKKSMNIISKYFLSDPIVYAMFDMTYSVKTNKDAFSKVNKLDFYNYARKNPDILKNMEKSMKLFSSMDVSEIVNLYNFGKYGVVVDIGCGEGHLMYKILEKNFGIKGILFDQPRVIEIVNQDQEKLWIDKRCEFISGDMFEKVPNGGDLYLISKVLNDWDDDKVLQILKNIRLVMSETSRLLILESLIDDNEVSIDQAGLVITNINLLKDQFYSIECKIK
ncbi:methyltransferase domain-containing protein [Clostridium felsineum]|uniref:acetylserotonin O-methyltransferase n=1 Tax=Clostridium felsineum TaxID=36839 RepID=UPI00214D6FF4|nr:acetylserotonin O-methyltransferase [Clostridium felsineum]MCR3758482.1 methyltransferase domain-containing protein [Clostridium felsineum]